MMMAGSLIALALLAAAAPLLARAPGRALGLVSFAVVFGLGCWHAGALTGVAQGIALVERYDWARELGAGISLRADGLGLAFSLLICFIASFVLLYAGSYMAKHPRRGQFFATLIAFTAAMLGVVQADNAILLFIFWELTSITSFLLIGFDDEREKARKCALQALLVTGLGGMVLLAGLILLGIGAGSFELSQMDPAQLRSSGLYTPAAVLVLIGAFTKSAIWPFHFWLPNAMEAPSPVSALLHSSTMVKAGVYLVMRLNPVLGGEAIWNDTLIAFGAGTMLLAAYLSTRRREFKKVLAYTTVSSLGALVMLVGMDAPKAAGAYLIAHALFKAALFLLAGSVVKKAGEKNVEALGGLFGVMPVAAVLSMIAAASMAGFFPLFGFSAKELMIKAGLHDPRAALMTGVIIASAVLLVCAAFLVGVKPFFGQRSQHAEHAYEPDLMQLAGPAVLVVATVVAGLAPALFAEPMVRAIAASIAGHALGEPLKLSAWSLLVPPTTATWLSILALALGAALYAVRGFYQRALAPVDALDRVGPERWYFGIFAGVLAFAAAQTRALQCGSLRWYVRITLLTLTALSGLALARVDAVRTLAGGIEADLRGLHAIDVVLAGSIIVGAIATTMQRQALAAVAVLGLVGFMSALFFVTFGAPDVASTQFAVETLVVVIFVLVVFHLPRYRNLTTRATRAADWLLASTFGIVMGVSTLLAAALPAPTPVSAAHAALSVPEGFGRNIVNVILVDFRAMDTLGEIFVVGVAAIGVYTLIRLRSGTLWTMRRRGGAP